ncbi:hypothetical protein PInf_024937 [Phytophthora infestans]|nr:hypothetical protein PInf_024937 [Phytophthora infestans]
MRKVDYSGHRVSKEGLEANPKDLSSMADLSFPQSLRAMQSFLGSLNYYSRFIEDYALFAVVLYELREVDFAAMTASAVRIKIQQALALEIPDPRRDPNSTMPEEDLKQELDPPRDQRKEDPIWIETTEENSEKVEPRWIRAQHAFVELRNRIATTPILRHFDPERQPTRGEELLEMRKVNYLGHRVSKEGLEANPKDLASLTDLSFR